MASKQRRWLRHLVTPAVAGALFALGAVFSLPASRATAAVAGPVVSVSPSNGAVGSVVHVSVTAPAGETCGTVFFLTSASADGFRVPAPGSPGQDGLFVIPSSLGPAVTGAAAFRPVNPGSYLFAVTCGTSAGSTTVSTPFSVTSSLVPPSRFVGMASTPDGKGYWLAQSGGGVFSYGDAAFYGSLPGLGTVLSAPIVGIAATPDGKGYWLVAADGGVFSFGDAAFSGSLPGEGIVPRAPVVSIAADPRGGGYWLLGADGGVFAFGAAPYEGSVLAPGPTHYASALGPFVALSAVGNGAGYYEAGVGTPSLSGQGQAWGFGDVPDIGSFGLGTSALLGAFLTGLAVTPNGEAGWLAGADGGIFDVAAPGLPGPGFYGSLPGLGVTPQAPIVGIAATPDDGGYWLVGADGGVFGFGDAHFFGSAAPSGLAWVS